MKLKSLRVLTGLFVFIISLFIYLLTVQPSVSFWDPGEISAASYSLMVPHPPGGPFWLLLGRIFSMIPFGTNIGYRINLVSVFSSALTVMLLYFIIVKLIETYRGREYNSISEKLLTYLPAVIGSFAFAFCDTFWFNAAESNYFAMSSLLFALVVWLMMVWNENHDKPGNEKYIVLMAYIIGISTGVHLMSVLAILTFVSLVVMKKYVTDEDIYLKSSKIFLVHILILLVVAVGLWASQTGTQPPTPDEYKSFDSKFIWIMLVISGLYVGVFRKYVFNRNSFYVPLFFGGIVLAVAYPGIVKIFPAILLKIGGPNASSNLIIFLVILTLLLYFIYWSSKNQKKILNLALLCFFFALLGFSTYTEIIIRANQNPPMNENDPANFTKLDYYLNRQQYGDFPIFKRRFSEEPNQQDIYTNYSSDLDFLWRYQINHMFNRYLLWNFAGRESTVQDAGVDWSKYFGIPFLLGLLGIYFHFRKDWKMASTFLILFIFMGYLIAFYQNQQQPQPRERFYFYPGAFFVFSIWIAVSVREISILIKEKFSKYSFNKTLAFSFIIVGAILVPGRMLRENYYTHDRSKNWLPWDLSYNMLQSCAPNAILFTAGDNDTFPLWYLQYVEGVRRDIRIVNLSLANTNWYLEQLKNTQPYGAEKVPFTLSDEQLETAQPIRWTPRNVSLPVPPDVLKKYNVKDSTVLKTGRIVFRMDNTLQFGKVKAIRVQDIAVKDIITANNWERPIYFANTSAPDSYIGLNNYLRMDGLTSRLTPVKSNFQQDYVNEPLVKKELFESNPSFSKQYDPRFKFRSLADKSVFFDNTQARLIQGYRNSFFRLADYYINIAHDSTMCVKTLDRMDAVIPHSHVPMDFRFLYEVGNMYYNAGAMDQFTKIAKEIEPIAIDRLNNNEEQPQSPYNSYAILEDLYVKQKEYGKAIDILNQLQSFYPNNPQLKSEILRLKGLLNSQQK